MTGTNRTTLALAAVLLIASVIAYANTWNAPFVFDDRAAILENPTLRGSLLDALQPPAGGQSVSGRPLLNVSFWLNHAVGAFDVRGYHLVNVLLHALAALVLFGIVRRTLGRHASGIHGLGDGRVEVAEGSSGAARERRDATARGHREIPPLTQRATTRMSEPRLCEDRRGAGFAFAVALLWAVHPLHTGAVTYVVQRAEVMAGVFCLLTLYGFIRAVESDQTASEWPQEGTKGAEAVPARKGRSAADRAEVGAQLAAPSNAVSPAATEGAASCAPIGTGMGATARFWFFVSITCCLLGVATKETVATAPLLVLLYDRTFVAGSFRVAWRARWRFYLTLASTWLVLGWLMFGTGARGGTVGAASGVTAWHYLLTQCEAIVRYLRLAVWPHPLVFDYGEHLVTRLADVAPQAVLLVAGFGATLLALRRRSAVGFLAAAFLLILAPTSSVVPVGSQTIAEHRLYLPLVAVILLVALAARRLVVAVVGRAAPAPGRTIPAAGRRGSGTGRSALLLPPLTRRTTGVVVVLTAVAGSALAAATFVRNRVYRSELALWQDTVAKRPANPRAHANLGAALLEAGQPDAAAVAFQRALQLQPGAAELHLNLCHAYTRAGRLAEAVTHGEAAVRLAPDNADAHLNLAAALLQFGRLEEAARHQAEAYRLQPAAAGLDRLRADTHLEQLRRFAREGAWASAREQLAAAQALAPEYAEVHFAAGNLAAAAEDFAGAIAAYQRALDADPEHVRARNNLANALLVSGRTAEAIEQYREVLRRRPGDASVEQNLRQAEAMDAQRSATPR